MPKGVYNRRSKAPPRAEGTSSKPDGRRLRYKNKQQIDHIANEILERYGTVGSKIFLRDFEQHMLKRIKKNR